VLSPSESQSKLHQSELNDDESANLGFVKRNLQLRSQSQIEHLGKNKLTTPRLSHNTSSRYLQPSPSQEMVALTPNYSKIKLTPLESPSNRAHSQLHYVPS
jgi:hypothetical protein